MEKAINPAWRKKFFNLKHLNKFLLLFFIVLGLYYVALANGLAIQGFTLRDLKDQRNKLSEANNKLELEAMNLSAYSNISQRISSLKMVAAGSINYINGGAELVAKK